MNILLAILALNFIVIIHELGHYLVAKKAGIKVLEFSLFFGPKLFAVQKGETLFSLRLFPVGAFVQLEGEEEASSSNRAFNNKPLPVRAAVIAAGPLMNLLSAFLFLCIVFFMTGYNSTLVGEVPTGSPAYEAGLQAGDRIIRYDGKKVLLPSDFYSFLMVSKGVPSEIEIQRQGQKTQVYLRPNIIPENRYLLGFAAKQQYGKESAVVSEIQPDSPAEAGGLLPGDRIIKLNDQEIQNKQDISEFLKDSQGQPVNLTVIREGKNVKLIIKPKLEKGSAYYETGITFQMVRGGVGETLKQPLIYIGSTIRSVIYTLVWLITGRVSIKQLAGPVRIVSIMSEVVSYSPTPYLIFINLLNISALISIAVGATNLLPFPALDGGKLLVLAVESIRKKPLPPEREAAISMVGFAILMLLGVFVLFNDIIQLICG